MAPSAPWSQAPSGARYTAIRTLPARSRRVARCRWPRNTARSSIPPAFQAVQLGTRCRSALGCAAMDPAVLSLRDIHLTFWGTPLPAGAELSAAPGDRLALVGRNGSGKSTLLKIAAGLIQPDSGERFVQPGLTVRYLPQEPDFSGTATTLDYVTAGLERGQDHHRARSLLDRLRLTRP